VLVVLKIQENAMSKQLSTCLDHAVTSNDSDWRKLSQPHSNV